MTKWLSRFVVLCAVLLASASVYAHHSLAGVYALGKEAKVSGAFKAFRFVNPHSTMKIEAYMTRRMTPEITATRWRRNFHHIMRHWDAM